MNLEDGVFQLLGSMLIKLVTHKVSKVISANVMCDYLEKLLLTTRVLVHEIRALGGGSPQHSLHPLAQSRNPQGMSD